MFVPLQIVDGFLLNVNLGDALLVGFVLGLLAVIPLGSRKILTIHVSLFGALLLMGPGAMYEAQSMSFLDTILQYKLVGLVLLVVAPVLYATADR